LAHGVAGHRKGGAFGMQQYLSRTILETIA
jgi:hypothetical protein